MSSSTSSSDRGAKAALRFLLHAGLFALCLYAILVVLIWAWPDSERNSYYEGLALKHQRLDQLQGEKLIIIGGSSATFGLDSEKLGNALCRPVVNMALHAALGFEFMVREIEGKINKGDVVIVGLEQSNFADPTKWNPEHREVFNCYPNGLNYFAPEQVANTVVGDVVVKLQYIWRDIDPWTPPRKPSAIYRADAFNEYGDMVAYTVDPEWDNLPLKVQAFEETLVGADFLPIFERLRTEVENAGATLVFIWPAIARSSYDPTRDSALMAELQSANIPIVGIPENNVFPDEDFLDTPYHLKLQGRSVHTQNVINALCGSNYFSCCTTALD